MIEASISLEQVWLQKHLMENSSKFSKQATTNQVKVTQLCVWNSVTYVLVQHSIQLTVQKKIRTSNHRNTCCTIPLQNGWHSILRMDSESYEQYEIPVANVEQELLYILENSEVKIQFYGTGSYRCNCSYNCWIDSYWYSTINQRCYSYWFW